MIYNSDIIFIESDFRMIMNANSIWQMKDNYKHMKIVRPVVDSDLLSKYIKSAERRLPKFIEIAKTKNTETLLKVCNVGLELFSCKLSIREELNELTSNLKLSLKAIYTLLLLKNNPNRSLLIDINGKAELSLTTNINTGYSDEDWLFAWYLAVILRNKQILEELYKQNNYSTIRTNEKDHIRIEHLWFRFLYSMHEVDRPDMNLFKEMKTIIDNNMKGYYMPDVDEFPYSNYYISFNKALILKAIIENDQDAFTEHLFDGLTYHKMLWGQERGLNKGDAPLFKDPHGFISWAHTALAAMAYDKGIRVEVESDYMPKWIVEGELY